MGKGRVSPAFLHAILLNVVKFRAKIEAFVLNKFLHTHNKFSPAFFKRRSPASGQAGGEAPRRVPQSAKSCGIFFFVDCPRRVLPRQSVFFCASGLKRKKRLKMLKLQGIAGVLCLRLVSTLGWSAFAQDVGEEPLRRRGCSPHALHSKAGCASRRNNAALWRIGEGGAGARR